VAVDETAGAVFAELSPVDTAMDSEGMMPARLADPIVGVIAFDCVPAAR
jgi:hypothetical protein